MLTDQTITNMQPHLANIAKHAGQVAAQSAGTLVTNHMVVGFTTTYAISAYHH
jgi:hypothetical protein